jgi:cell division protein FtsW
MSRTARPIDKMFLGLVIGLTLFGLVMLLSASGPLALSKTGDSWYYFKHQMLNGMIPGIFAFVVLSYFDYRKLKYLALPALILSIGLLLLVYIPGVGTRLGGAGRWVHFGALSFQPSEFVKVTFLIYVAAWLSTQRERRASNLQEGLLPFLSVLGIVILLLILQPNTGSMAVIAGASLIVYFVAGAPLGWFAALVGLGLGLIALLIKITPYRTQRLMTFLHPELDPQGVGYHINQAFLAIGSGGPFGLGYGHSRQKYSYLPEVAGDSIFAVLAEELGFFLSVAFIAALALLVKRCFTIAQSADTEFGRFLAAGIGGWIAIQTVLNVGSMIGLLPITGVTLPLVSYGSSALVATAAGLGIVASISRQSRISS